MTIRRSRVAASAVSAAFCLALSRVLGAHHSQSEYDLKGKVDVEGAVTKVEWRSPHAWIYVDVVSDKGETVNWSFELPSPVTLMRRGWTRDSVKPGDRVKVTAAPAKNFPAIAIANVIRDDTGKPLFTGTTQVYDVDAASKESK
jgi:hypothetical protein